MALAGLVAGCSDHRVEDVCDKICTCSAFGDRAIAACNAECIEDFTSLNDAEVAISDECVGCIEQTECSSLEFSCTRVCEIDDQQGDPVDVSN